MTLNEYLQYKILLYKELGNSKLSGLIIILSTQSTQVRSQDTNQSQSVFIMSENKPFFKILKRLRKSEHFIAIIKKRVEG